MYYSLPKEYRQAEQKDLIARIEAARAKLGERLCVLAHHYQRREVVACSDHVGDSYGLSKLAAENKNFEIILFCGVHFMAESADILSSEKQKVFLANPLAGCPMADMADMADVMEAWKCLEKYGSDEKIMPISYMNTTADLKAFTGRHGGLICTSSNAVGAFEYGFERCEKLFFFPDENLGYNTGLKHGLKPDEMVLWDFSRESGGLTDEQLERARLILWKGHCHVHTNFKAEHVTQMRIDYPDVKVIVHPECLPEVVSMADGSGSTKYIVDYCKQAPAGSTIAIGTEINLIDRMAQEHPDKKIVELSGQVCPVCANMYRTTLNDLAYCLENFADLKPIEVKEPVRSEAMMALEKMLQIS